MSALRSAWGVFPDELAALLQARGVACEARAAASIVSRTWWPPHLARPKRETVRRGVREAADAALDRTLPEVVERAGDADDGSLKYLLRLADGALVEVVRIPLARPGCFTLCLSSQVGCGMGCAFCATARLGLRRQLSAAEIAATFVRVRDETPGRVTGAVFMGQGEPLHNYDAVVRAARLLSHPAGGRLAAKAISISTVGLVPQIRRFTREGHRFRLVVSLTSAVQRRREALMPIASRHGLPALAAALRDHAAARGRVTVAWVVLGGVNTGPDEVDALRALLGDVPIRLNLIDVNDARPDGYRRATIDELARFRDGLASLGVPVVRRYSVGRAGHAACGMLAARALSAAAPAAPQ